ncbi:putative bifunctional diguanylate cyclase/phosphodiesterase [Nitriliruptor alkaliphilus]|uniref:putative bifunctional diguanylate cyclase/phosphodiesterase n=1 Tax=Nitriliruptor alkaliphilus TaxID=427918 RepID=UPI000695CE91|nr:GGDEF domain-containing phosphodiesterase [Nitriliruptor alkaliphilus]
MIPRPDAGATSSAVQAFSRRVLRVLPTGDTLSPVDWHARHVWICRILWVHVAAVPIYGLGRDHSLVDSFLEGGVVVTACAVAASSDRLSRSCRSLLATLGLVVTSALLVHLSGGLIEMHFHFFVVVILASFYQAWRPFLVALAVVMLHHGIVGSLDPAGVYNHPSAIAAPWRWSLLHGGFVLAASAASVAAWRLNEDALARERGARVDLAAAQRLASLGSWEWDAQTGRHTWSDELYRMYGLEPGDPARLDTFLAIVHPDDRVRVAGLLQEVRAGPVDLDYECRLVLPDGRTRTIHALGHAVIAADGVSRKMIGTCLDITEREALREQLTHRAFYDGLTGLANRALFLDRLEHALHTSRRSGDPTTVLYVDLNGFKAVNDTHGHRAGDKLLIEVARRLGSLARESDTVARLAGDEFALLLPGADAAAGEQVAERITALLSTPVELGDHRQVISASIGVAESSHAAGSDELLHHADVAMYTVKRSADRYWATFRPELSGRTRQEVALRRELGEAIGGGEFLLHYQPIIDLATGETVSLEALVRWHHPRYGLLAPSEFICLAEQSGQIVALGTWVTHEATRQAAELEAQLGQPVHVSVNLAARQLDGDVTSVVRSALEQAGLPPQQLTLELTETGLMSRPEEAVGKLEQLRSDGVTIAVDDFGTGYSSLAYLKQLPIDILKIDRSFIRSIAEGPEEAGLAHAIIKLAHIFGMRTIAEGIETSAQARTLRKLGCDRGQGFLFSRPVPPDAVADVYGRALGIPEVEQRPA